MKAMKNSEELEQPVQSAQPVQTERLQKRAAELLVRRAKTTGQMRDQLAAWGADAMQQEEIVTWLQTVGLLDDAAYARRLVEYYTARGYGPYRLRAELQRRQVPHALWEDALSGAMVDPETLDAFLQKKLTDPTDPAQLRRATAALARRGFSWEEITEAVRRVSSQGE